MLEIYKTEHENFCNFWLACAGKEKTLLLQQAFTQIRSVFEARPVADGPELFGQDLFVQCAEIAFEVNILVQ